MKKTIYILFAIAPFVFAISVNSAGQVVAPATNTVDVVSAVPFYPSLGIVRLQQVYPSNLFSGSLHLTNVSFSISATNTLIFTNLQLKIALLTNGWAFNGPFASNMVTSVSNYFTSLSYTSALSTAFWNLSFPMTNISYPYNPTNGQLLIELKLGQTSGFANTALSSTPGVYRAWSNTASFFIDPESIPTLLQYTNP